MRKGRWTLLIGLFLLVSAMVGLEATLSHSDEKPNSGLVAGQQRIFLYTAKRLGIPILKASIKIENGSSEKGKPLYQIHANIESLDYLKLLFRMHNQFVSTVDAETCSPIRYVKEIDQQGLLIERKRYLQTLFFDHPNKKVVVEKTGIPERQEYPLLSETVDPLSLFAKYYLKEGIHPGQSIPISIFDGIKIRQMVFHSKKGKLKTQLYGEVEAVCLESATSFSSFNEREGMIRIWYTADGKKIPVLIELDLPIGDVIFELKSIEEG
ncbi:MAG: DUF3108 domain-containing protein [Syntrophaceae bacterium]|nr:DUF3108 domain-containing protein [Syntrophaceae bacterium]